MLKQTINLSLLPLFRMGMAATKQEAFWEACGFGNVAEVEMYLTMGIDVNWKSYTVSSPYSL